MNSQFSNVVFILGMMAVFYFLIMRPQQQRAKAQREMIAAVKVGDEIVTVGGIFATVVEVGDRLRVRVADGSEFELARQAVGQIVPVDDSGEEDPTGSVEEGVTPL